MEWCCSYLSKCTDVYIFPNGMFWSCELQAGFILDILSGRWAPQLPTNISCHSKVALSLNVKESNCWNKNNFFFLRIWTQGWEAEAGICLVLSLQQGDGCCDDDENCDNDKNYIHMMIWCQWILNSLVVTKEKYLYFQQQQKTDLCSVFVFVWQALSWDGK